MQVREADRAQNYSRCTELMEKITALEAKQKENEKAAEATADAHRAAVREQQKQQHAEWRREHMARPRAHGDLLPPVAAPAGAEPLPRLYPAPVGHPSADSTDAVVAAAGARNSHSLSPSLVRARPLPSRARASPFLITTAEQVPAAAPAALPPAALAALPTAVLSAIDDAALVAGAPGHLGLARDVAARALAADGFTGVGELENPPRPPPPPPPMPPSPWKAKPWKPPNAANIGVLALQRAAAAGLTYLRLDHSSLSDGELEQLASELRHHESAGAPSARSPHFLPPSHFRPPLFTPAPYGALSRPRPAPATRAAPPIAPPFPLCRTHQGDLPRPQRHRR